MRVSANQSLFDVAIQEDGSVFTVLDWALANNISITATLTPGMDLIAPAAPANRDIDIVNYFNGRILATYDTPEASGNVFEDYLLPQTLPFL